MNIEKKYHLGICLTLAIYLSALFFCNSAFAQEKIQVVRMAKIQIDSVQLENYKAALKEGIETAVRVEPGVISLYAVYEKNNPTHVTVIEVYADQEAYKSHLQTAHFKKYKNTTKDMVKSLELIETIPIALSRKMKE